MREDFVGNVERNLSSLESLLGKENVDDVKKRIADLIVNRVEDDLKHYDCYLFYPPDYSECINEAFSKVQKKICKIYEDAMLEAARNAVENFKNIVKEEKNE